MGTDDVKRLLLCAASVAALLVQASAAQAAAAQAATPLAAAPQAARLDDNTAKQLRALIDAAQQDSQRKAGGDKQKIADFYASYMDVQRLDSLGYKPLIGELQRIRVLRDRRGLPQVIAHLRQIGVATPYAIEVRPGTRPGTDEAVPTDTVPTDAVPVDAGLYMAHIVPGQLGMPNRAAYLAQDDASLQALRAKYARFVEQVLTLGGARDPAAAARGVLTLETAMAQLQGKKTQAAQPVVIDKLGAMAAGYDWASALGAAGVSSKTERVFVDDPAYLAGFAKLAAEADLASWKAYLEWQLLRSYAPYLSAGFARAHAAFYDTPPVGQPDLRPRWQAGVDLTSTVLADLLGKQYVASHLPPERKARIERIVAGQLAACSGPDTQGSRGADKLGSKALRAKVGHPAKWPGNHSLTVTPIELVGNIMRVRQRDTAHAIARIGMPVDRDEWTVPVLATGIVYDPVRHELVLPAAALQPPLVDDHANDTAIGIALGERIGQACARIGAR